MRLSVVMAVRNGEPHIREAIESVLSQSIADFEFLIVDDASPDTTREIVSSYQCRDARVRLICNARTVGPYPSANRGLHEARGEFVARHDADDISPPDRFAIQLAALQADVSTALVTGAVEAFNSSGPTFVVRPPHWQPRLEWDLLFSNVVGAGAHVMFPRVFEGRPVSFPATHRYAEDYGMWCSLARRGRVVCPPDVVYRHRHHETSISSSCKSEQDECFAMQRHAYQSLYSEPAARRSPAATSRNSGAPAARCRSPRIWTELARGLASCARVSSITSSAVTESRTAARWSGTSTRPRSTASRTGSRTRFATRTAVRSANC